MSIRINVSNLRQGSTSRELEERLGKVVCSKIIVRVERVKGITATLDCTKPRDALKVLSQDNKVKLRRRLLHFVLENPKDMAKCEEDARGQEDFSSDDDSTNSGGSSCSKGTSTPSEDDGSDFSGSPKQASPVEAQALTLPTAAPGAQTGAPEAQAAEEMTRSKKRNKKKKVVAAPTLGDDFTSQETMLQETQKALEEAKTAKLLAEAQAKKALQDLHAAKKEGEEHSRRALQTASALVDKEIQLQRMAKSNLALEKAKNMKEAEANAVIAQLQGQLQVAKGQVRDALADLCQARSALSNDKEAWRSECHQAQKALEKLRKVFTTEDPKLQLQEQKQAFEEVLTNSSTIGSLKVTVEGLWSDISEHLAKERAMEEREEEASTVLQNLQKKKLGLEHSLARAEEECQRALEEAELSKQDAEGWKKQLEMTTKQLNSIRKDLGERLLCPVSFQPMRQPVMGTDLRTYQKDAIEQALDVKATSPFTRRLMEKGSLRPNLVVADIVDTMTKHFPDWEATTSPHRQPPAPPIREELVDAISCQDSDQALDLLGRDVDDDLLNGGIIYQSTNMNLLQLCISVNLPKVALAVANRPDFRRTESFSEQGLLAIHMAAANGFADVCHRILTDVGGSALTARTLQDVEFADLNGQSVLIPEGSTAVECARLFGHQPDWAVIADC